MPSSTFFRLPEEKRSRLMKEVWKEFTRVPYADVSINRIIRGAHIPRGSFYQYFEDKNDLFLYLLDGIRGKYLVLFDRVIEETKGDLFAMPALLLDGLIAPDGSVVPHYSQVFQLLSLNVSMDVRRLFFDRAEDDLSKRLLSDRLDTTKLRSSEPQYIETVFSLLIGILGDSVGTILSGHSTRQEEYERLKLRVEIIRSGSAKGEP